ncbi:phosphotransferase [Caballeronia sp. LZ043]|uniref:phosphotransferase enzyme family protein n=1 Tax=Caballeronia sp. LZ043 TaxID=3038569 RepID=UPI00285C55F7|nr:phosphotransferase [Caballeronia sp. LZ043]MDR5823657.1 phosphotransferase [Caballeronia sp. LZ043]
MTELELQSSGPLSAAYSTIDGDALGGFIASAYAFDAPFTCRLLRRGFNDVYLLRFADGHKKIARLSSRRARGASNVAYETALLRHLKQAGGDVAAPLGTNTGALSIEVEALEGRRSLVVFEYLEGQFPGVDLQDTKAMAASLATLHRLAGNYDGPPSQYVLDLGHLVMRPLQRLLDHESTDEALAERLRKIAADLVAKIEAARQLTRVVCHGDCHGGNTFMTSAPDGRRIGSFFDFDAEARVIWPMTLRSISGPCCCTGRRRRSAKSSRHDGRVSSRVIARYRRCLRMITRRLHGLSARGISGSWASMQAAATNGARRRSRWNGCRNRPASWRRGAGWRRRDAVHSNSPWLLDHADQPSTRSTSTSAPLHRYQRRRKQRFGAFIFLRTGARERHPGFAANVARIFQTDHCSALRTRNVRPGPHTGYRGLAQGPARESKPPHIR